jgi:hypothetical protein
MAEPIKSPPVASANRNKPDFFMPYLLEIVQRTKSRIIRVRVWCKVKL